MTQIVLDTNCLIASLSKRGNYFGVWKSLHEGKYKLCVSNEILEEYEEIISLKTTSAIAANVIQTLINSPYVVFVNPYYHFHLITQDKDDNKFVDCAIAANATYIVSEDHHFDALMQISFPKVNIIALQKFLDLLSQ
ncbi:MAG: putative toxin-antitoxin system toxin component, PIN family [Bacteroides sp.]|nr:putative toxin-antitoxin system toxin component, PIN family [Bacteroides sp.]MBO5015401.1 putative toxin-antitoxin system toxin component, PIN family [Bacteroidaceae bacterium]